MTNEEIAEEYAEKVVRHKMAVHDIFNEKVTKKEIKDAVIYGLKAGCDTIVQCEIPEYKGVRK